MAKIKTAEEAAHNYACESLRAFLEGKQTLKWLLGVVRSSRVDRDTLFEIFKSLRSDNHRQRFEEAVQDCREEGLLP